MNETTPATETEAQQAENSAPAEPSPASVVEGQSAPAPSGGPTLTEAKLPNGVYYRRWDVESPRAIALIVHGLGEHSGRYQHVAEALAVRGIASVAPDHPGHGQSPGDRCYIGSFEEYFVALDQLVGLAQDAHPGLPMFIIGHSMGGLIAGNYILDRQNKFAGAAFSGAAFEVPEPPAAAAIFINKLIAMILPRLGVLQLDASEVSRDKEVVTRYMEDPLVHSGKISAKLVVELFSAMGTLETRRGAIELPVLIMHGEGDVMAAPNGSVNFHKHISSDDNTLRLYPTLYHEIFNEPEQDDVLKELCDWMEARL
ncbi:MAG: lysophospholipase [Pseudomonadota bacterium]